MRTRTYALAAAALAAAGLGATLVATTRAPAAGLEAALAACRGGAVAGGDLGGPFTLVNAQGEEVTDREVFTRPSILYFGYTFCPDVCPLDAMRNAEAVRVLEERGLEATPVFVSFDPARDTPEVVGAFAANFHPRMVGLTGSPDQVKAASEAYRTYYARAAGEEGEDPDYYLMDHSAFSYLVLPEVGFVDFVDREEAPEAVADRLQCFAEAQAAA